MNRNITKMYIVLALLILLMMGCQQAFAYEMNWKDPQGGRGYGNLHSITVNLPVLSPPPNVQGAFLLGFSCESELDARYSFQTPYGAMTGCFPYWQK